MGVEIGAAAAAFLAVTSFALMIFSRPASARAVERRLVTVGRQEAGPARIDASGILRTTGTRFSFLRGVLSSNDRADRASVDLLQAGLALKVSEYFLLRALLSVLCAILGFLLAGGGSFALIVGMVGALIGFMVPSWYVAILKQRRINTINEQLVETLQLISNSLRSGFAFTQAVEMAAKQVEPPIQDELHQFLQDNALGARSDEALLAMVERTGSYDVDMMVTTIIVQRTTGGNLSEILDNVAETVRERERLQGEIRALTSQQRLTGLVLTFYPPALGLVLFALAPHLMKVMITEPAGRVMLVIAVILQVIGALVIRKILRLDV
jgi:tight adherence protein B